MTVRKRYLRIAMRSHGYIDENGHVILMIMNNGHVSRFYYFNDNNEVVFIEPEDFKEIFKSQNLMAVPRIFPGYAALKFIKEMREVLHESLLKYGLTEYLDDVYPCFLSQDTSPQLESRGRELFGKLILMLDEDEDENMEDLFNDIHISMDDEIMQEWCKSKNIVLID